MMIKDVTIRTLISGDKSARITLEMLDPLDLPQITTLSESIEVDVKFDNYNEK